MRCFPGLSLNSDFPHWIHRDVLFERFDQHDFHNRECQKLSPAYLTDWFYTQEDGITRFILPTVQIIAGRTEFINGRHRTAVLLEHIELLPIAFALGNNEHEDLIERFNLRPLALDEFIELPDLPVLNRNN